MTKPIVSGPYRTFRELNRNESYIEYEGSTITIPMKGRRSPGEPWMEETVKLEAFMRLEIYPPYINNLGTREFQFTIRDWDLYGKSPMLNQLFFGDPRGQLVTDEKSGFSDYVPAVLTFRVNDTYRMTVSKETNNSVRELFGSDFDIEIRNLTSHHLRVWAPSGEKGDGVPQYSHPNNRIYWQIVSTGVLKENSLTYLVGALKERDEAEILSGGAFLLFHKKAPNIPGDSAEFDVSNPEDRARYLLAVSTVAPQSMTTVRGDTKMMARATLPMRGLNGAMVQKQENAVLSSLHRQIEGLDIRIPLAPGINSAGDFGEIANKVRKDAGSDLLKGEIVITSASRSIGTSDQAPEKGEALDSADFPARITYAINYDIFINRERFVEDQAGVAIAVGVEDVPPRDVRVAFEKPQEGLVVGRHLDFSAGRCTGMNEIPPYRFHEGMNFSRYWRTVPLESERLNSAAGEFLDYDPSRNY